MMTPCKAHRTGTNYALSNVQQSTALPMSCQVSPPTPSLIPSLAKSKNIATLWSKDPIRKRNGSVHSPTNPAQGVGAHMPTGTDTIFFIPRHKVPKDCKVTYGHICCSIRPQKSKPIAQDSPLAETNSTIQEMSAHPPQASPLPNASSTASS